MFKALLLAFLVNFVTVLSVSGQSFQNLDLQQKCDSSKTGFCHWNLSWGPKGAASYTLTDNRPSLLLYGNKENSVSFVEQLSTIALSGKVQILSLSAYIKCDSVIGKGAGLNIGLYDDKNVLIGSKDMGGFYSIDWIRGTAQWKKYTISIVCPAETRTIKIGMILFGKGKAWYRDLSVEAMPIEGRRPTRLATRYIDAVCDTIIKNSLVRDSINIDELKQTAYKIAGPAKRYSDCYLAVNFLLGSLRQYGDHHSFFMTAAEVKNWESEGSQVSKLQFPFYNIIDSCAYILIPPFHGGNPAQMTAYADSIQAAIETLSTKNIKGWIVDLRSNTGGNMEPMIAGLGPLFSSEKLGALIDVNGRPGNWYYKAGKYYSDSYAGWSVTRPFKPAAILPIAVLTSNQTGSSGEIVTISFIGNADTRSFGGPTWGLTTGNGSFDLKDGSQIFLASTVMADRNGRRYTASIDPDMLIDNDPATVNDEVIDAAIKWISAPVRK